MAFFRKKKNDKRLEKVYVQIVKNIKQFDELYCRSRNLFNYTNNIITRYYVINNKLPDLEKLKSPMRQEHNIIYRSLPAKTSELIIDKIYKSWLSFVACKKEWKKDPILYCKRRGQKYVEKNPKKCRPQMPHYKKEKQKFLIMFYKPYQTPIKNNHIHFPKMKKFGLDDISPIHIANNKILAENISIQEVQIISFGKNIHKMILTYRQEKKKLNNLNYDNYLAIDPGINQLATCTTNLNLKPFAINGKPLKAKNNHYNKKISKLKSQLGTTGYTNRMQRCNNKRSRYVDTYMHTASKYIINYCIENNIGNIVIGKNFSWKQRTKKMGKRFNIKFIPIPFGKFISKIKYKANEIGIRVRTINESYTSKCSFIDSEDIKKHNTYMGKRRGNLYFSKNKEIIHSDVSGSYNILRKVVPEFNVNMVSKENFHPRIVNLDC